MSLPILKKLLCLISLTGFVVATTAAAQSEDTPAKPSPMISLELNNATDAENDSCRLTYVATNHSGKAISQIAYQVGVFDAEGIVRRILVLEFGALTVGKTKIVLFDLAEQKCSDISRIIVNDVAKCTLADDASDAGFCLKGLVTNSRNDIQFTM